MTVYGMTMTVAPNRNHLSEALSPYLLQHADNPVHWLPWGTQALEHARKTDRPILLSIGYAACHWCHVMAHESFEDQATADEMNNAFICIKVDREERPDIDHIYMSALHAMGQQGGWPLTMFLTPEGQPFWGGTYFPPEPRFGRPSFRQVLAAIRDAWANRRSAIEQNLGQLTRAMNRLSETAAGPEVDVLLLNAVDAALLRNLDPEKGGFTGAPKFPNAPVFRFFWQEFHRTGRPELSDAVHAVLSHMARGGIYDHLGGGFARYSTDAEWLVPHFEKMAYDNGQILELLSLGYAQNPTPLYARCIEETVGWLIRDMSVPVEGGGTAFAASEDADSEGEEGRFYIWHEDEIDALLGEAANGFKQAFDVTREGNWEGHTILRRLTISPEADAESWAQERRILFQSRENRPRPGRDDKVLADWNGLVIVGLVRAAIALNRADWLSAAESAYEAVRAALGSEDGRIAHAWRLGRITAAGLLDDQASMIRAALSLYEATGQERYLSDAVTLAQSARSFFSSETGAFYTTAHDADDVPLTRPCTASDNAVPSGNGMMADALARLYHFTGEQRWYEAASGLIRAFTGRPQSLASSPYLLMAADLLTRGTLVSIHGQADDPHLQSMVREVLALGDPSVLVCRKPLHAAPDRQTDHVAQTFFVLVCRQTLCSAPLTTLDAVKAAISAS
ncbi:Thymidylate kinase [Granulibacter bethesdensis CGDNIH4]|nr:Thymidylate kinase [Granulibacter bethesdensis CGDNIH4]